MSIWVLTREINKYDQEGEYFEAAFKQKPTPQQLILHEVSPVMVPHVLDGGGRLGEEDEWWYLRIVDLQ